MAVKRNNLVLAVIPLMLAFAAIGYISLHSSSYLEVSELKKYDEPVKVSVIGNVTKGSVRFVDGHLEFTINDGKNYVKVVYPAWVRLDNVSGYGQATVKGIYYPDRNVIEASMVQSKCPSKQEMAAYKEEQ